MELSCGVAQLRFVHPCCPVSQTARHVLGDKPRTVYTLICQTRVSTGIYEKSIFPQDGGDLDAEGCAGELLYFSERMGISARDSFPNNPELKQGSFVC